MGPICNNMGIRGLGKIEATFCIKANDFFNYTKKGVIILLVDALVGFLTKD